MMRSSRRYAASAALLALLALLSCRGLAYQQGGIRLISDAKSSYRIMLFPGSTESDLTAASELQRYITEISGVKIPIISPDVFPEEPVILIASSSNKMSRSLPVDWDKLEDDGFEMKTAGENIIIAGGGGKGSLYGVYSFLEKQFGCRKYSPGVEIIPKRSTIVLPAFDEIQLPKIKFRDAYFYDPSYMAWHKLDNHDDLFGMYVHTFRTFVPPERYFDNHPEYFSKVKSGRIPDGQLCLTNNDVFEIILGELGARMAARPDRSYWSVSQNDTFSPCECDSCKSINDAEGSPSGSLIWFVNKIAGRFPDKTISTLAYQYSRSAPKNIKPAPNVNVMLCSIECNRSKPLEADPGSASFLKDLEDWTRLTKNIYLWDYVVNFKNYLCPFPNLRVLQPNIRYFAKNGMTRIFEQGSGKSLSEFKELRTYLISKLLWNPDENIDSLIDDFLSGYYGDRAAPYIRTYIDEMHSALESSGEELWIYGYPLASERGYLSARMLDRYGSLFDSAEVAAADDRDLLDRVRAARLPLQFTLIEQAKGYGAGDRGFFEISDGPDLSVRPAMRSLLDTFVRRCEYLGYTAVEEMGKSPRQYYETTLGFLEKSARSHLASGKPVRLLRPASPKYHGGDRSALTDGMRGWDDYHMNWLGFEGEDMEAVIDLGSVRNISRISTDFLQDNNSWIFLPLAVEYSYSNDGFGYQTLATVKNISDPKKNGAFISPFAAEFGKTSARYVRIRAENVKICPPWHKGAGGEAWIFVDEIVVE